MLFWLIIASFLILFESRVPEVLGHLGDSFGMLNSFFSALAFAGVLYSMWQQYKTIKNQEEEIKANRLEASQQISILNLQLIETTFLNNLNSVDGIIGSLNTINRDPSKGSYFEDIYGKLHSAYFSDGVPPNLIHLRNFFYNNEWQFGHYFRFIKVVLKLIDESNIPQERKNVYIGILQSKMSNDELRTFLYHTISDLSDNDDMPGTITYSKRTELQRIIKKYDFFGVVRTRPAINLINPSYDWKILRRLVYEPFDNFSMHDL
jgi:Putative phage abortive infection protein